MNTRGLRALRVPAALALALTMILVALPTAAAQEEPPPDKYLYVFGDSFASGEGVDFYVPGSEEPFGCHKSIFSFGFRLFASLDQGPTGPWPNRFFPACSGAKARDIIDQDQDGDGPQLSQTVPVPDGGQGIAFVAVGVNDLGFTPVLTECVLRSSCHTTSPIPQITDPEGTWEAAAPNVFEAYLRIANWVEGSGQMDVYIVGYMQLFDNDATNFWCPGALGIEPDERAWLNERARAMNDNLETLASWIPNVHFIEVDDHFEGHRLCNPEPWVHGIQVPIEHSFHPNPTGHFVVEQIVLNYFDANGLLD